MADKPTRHRSQFVPDYEVPKQKRWDLGTALAVAAVDETLHGESKHAFHVKSEDETGASNDPVLERFYDFALYPIGVGAAATLLYWAWLRANLRWIIKKQQESGQGVDFGKQINKAAQANAAARVMFVKSFSLLLMTAVATLIVDQLEGEPLDDPGHASGDTEYDGLLEGAELMWASAFIVAIFAGIGIYYGVKLGQKYCNEFVDHNAADAKGFRWSLTATITTYTFVLHLIAHVVDHELEGDIRYIGIPVAFVAMALILYFVTPCLTQRMTNGFEQSDKVKDGPVSKMCAFGNGFIGGDQQVTEPEISAEDDPDGDVINENNKLGITF